MRRRGTLPALILIAAGLYFLLRQAGVIHGATIHYVIAVILIIWGVFKLIGRGD